MVKLLKGTKKMYNDLEKEVIEVELTDKKGFKAMWQKIVDDFDAGESSQAILAKKMGWPDKQEGQNFAIECLKTDLIARMDMPLSKQRFRPFYLELTQESEYDGEKKKWSSPFPVVRGAGVIYDDVEEGLKLAVLTAKRDSSKIAEKELKVGKTYDGTFIDWTGKSEADVLGLAIAENSTFTESDEAIDIDPIEWLREQYERTMVKDARKNFTDSDDPLDYVLVEGKVVTSRIKTYRGSDNRDGILTITDESISLLDMRKSHKDGVRPLIDVKTVSPVEVTLIGKDSYIQALGPLKDRDQMKKGSEDEVERSWNPQLTARSLIVTLLVEKEEEEEEPESEEEEAEDAGEVYAEAQARKFDDEGEDEEGAEDEDGEPEEEPEPGDEGEPEEEPEPEESEPDEAPEPEAEPEPEEEGVGEPDACEDYGTDYDPDDDTCGACDDAKECEKLAKAAKKGKKATKKKAKK